MEAMKVLKGPAWFKRSEYPLNPEQKTQILFKALQDLQEGQKGKDSEGIRGLVAPPILTERLLARWQISHLLKPSARFICCVTLKLWLSEEMCNECAMEQGAN